MAGAKSASVLALGLVLGCAEPDLPALTPLEGEFRASAVQNDALPDQLTVGHRMMAAGQYELALRAYTRAFGVARPEQTAEILLAVGSANARLGRVWRARRTLESAVTADPRSVTAWNNLGVVQMSLNDPFPALDAFRTADRLARGRNSVVRRNIERAEALLQFDAQPDEMIGEFVLVRQGSGRYRLEEQSE